MYARIVSLLVAATLAATVAATAGAEDWIYTVPDYKKTIWVPVTKTIPTWIGIDKKIPFDGRIRIGIKDEIKVTVTVPVPIFAPTYIKISTGAAGADPEPQSLTLTDIYAVDLQPTLNRNEIPLMTGFDPLNPQMIPQGPERFLGISGAVYTAEVLQHRLSDLPSVLPGYDLSQFAQGDPNSIVYVAQTQVPLGDFLQASYAWVGDVSNQWTGTENWSPVSEPGGPNEPGTRLTFGWDAFPALNPVCELDADRLVGRLEFYPGQATTITGPGVLTLQDYTTGPGILVAGETHRISADVVSNQDLDINLSAGSLTLAGAVSGGGNLSLAGPGNLSIAGNTNIAGTTLVSPESQLTVVAGGVLTTNVWRNPGKDIVLAGGNANIAQDLIIPGGGVFEASGSVTVGGTTTVEPGATLTVQPGGLLQTRVWRNPGTDIVRLGGRAEILEDLTVGGPGVVDSFFDIFGEVNVGGTTLVNPGGTLTVQEGGVFNTRIWRNPGKDIVLPGGTALITEDLILPSPGVFEAGGTVSVGGTTRVEPGARLIASGAVQTVGLNGGGAVAVVGGRTEVARKPAAWTTNLEARQSIGSLEVAGGGGGGALLDVMNNLVSVNYDMAATPYPALAEAVNRGAILQTARSDRTVGIYDTAAGLDGSAPGTVRVGYAAPGDTMMRGYVDSSDIINILAAGKYDTGPSEARWDEGDFTHDRQVDSDDVIGLLAAGVYDTGAYDGPHVGPGSVISGPPSAARATVIYDTVTGDVKIDPNGNTLSSFRLKDSAANFFAANALLPPGAFTTNTATQKFWSTFNAPFLIAVWDMGNVAPAGLTEAQFTAALNNAAGDSTWTAQGGGSFNFNMQYVPEPATWTLLAAGSLVLAAMLARRRKL